MPACATPTSRAPRLSEGRAAPRRAHARDVRRSVRAPAALRCRGADRAARRQTHHVRAGPRSCTAAASRRARSRWRCRPGAASIAGSAATVSSSPIRSPACARRARRSRCRRRSRWTTRSRWSSIATRRRSAPGGARRLHRRAALRLRLARRRAGRPRRRRERHGRRLGRCRRCHRPRARQGRQAARRAGRRAGAGGARGWLAVRAQIARADEAALFVGSRGTRLPPSQVRSRLKARGDRRRRADARPSAHAAPFVRFARAAVERRSARGPGAARPRQHHDHAGLHQARFPASLEGLRRRASARARASERGRAGPPRESSA